MNVGVILVQIWCNTLCDDNHDIHDIARNHTINTRYQTVFLKLEEIISTFGRIQKNAPFFGAFFIISSMNRGANYDCLAANYQFRLDSPSYDVPAAQFGVKMAIIS